MTKGIEQKENILDAAFVVFGANGYHDAKMIDIAKRAGVSKGTLYLYFPSKESLYIAVNDRSFFTSLLTQSEKPIAVKHLGKSFIQLQDITCTFFITQESTQIRFGKLPIKCPE
nr:helix-turn-helix domain-containing protein [Priestia flexa]WEZ06696.1 helix-turn-helix domain containing protein [Priestia flexa]